MARRVTRTRFEWDSAKDEGEPAKALGIVPRGAVRLRRSAPRHRRGSHPQAAGAAILLLWASRGRNRDGSFYVSRRRDPDIRAGYWRRGKAIYEHRIKYSDEPLRDLKVIADFLPPPEQLAFREEGVKVNHRAQQAQPSISSRPRRRAINQYSG